ncbi:MAG: Zn-dependent alcohol dehydrogenase [Dehalococcoidia bacterium]|nr:MAG: Zn-dependent alcohol dehydrogenase [Dehalococcoidia bacterium]
MKMRAAILEQLNTPLVIEEVELDDPKDKEVLVKLVATGVCHTDIHCIKGDLATPPPVVLGHEGAGIVEKVGKNVTEVQPGDKVVVTVAPYCGKCPACMMGVPTSCETDPQTAMLMGTMADGTKRLRRKSGDELSHFMAQSSFAEYAVVEESATVKVRDDAPLDVVCLLACGASTGIGAVINKAKVKAGSSVAVFGCGGVGMAAIMAAKLVGAHPIIAVDMLDNKLEVAREFGATNLVNASKEDPVVKIAAECGGGVDYSFEAIGKPEVMTQAFHSVYPRPGGMALILGLAPIGSTFPIEAWRFMRELVITGCTVGSIHPRIDIPRYIDLFMAGKLPLDKLVSAHYSLDRINDAIKDTLEGKVLRGIITF